MCMKIDDDLWPQGISNNHAEQAVPYTPGSAYCGYWVMVLDGVGLK